MPAKLSKTMSEALDKARQHGALVRIPGGFWTFPGCPTTRRRGGGAWGDYDSPDWSVAVGTARSLVRRGLLDWSEYAENGSGSFPVAATPTDPPKEN